MRLSLVHQVALLLAAAVLLAVSALGAAVAWNVRAGFGDYLRAQDEAWLQRFAQRAAALVEREGAAVLTRPFAWRALAANLDAEAPAAPPLDRAEPFGRADAPPPDRPGPPPHRAGPPPDGLRPDRPPRPGPPRDGRRPPPDDLRRFDARLSLWSAAGQPLGGRPPMPGARVLEQAIVVNGDVIALARLQESPPAERSVDAAFLARQYRGILLAAGVLLLLAIAGAVWIGRRWVRPLAEVQRATARIAAGAFDARVPQGGNDELGDLASGINRMAAALQGLEASRRRWIAELSHELRTPLAVLRGELEALLDGVRPVDRAALQSLQAEVARLTGLTEDFHQLALSDLRALPCRFAAVAPAQLLAEAGARVAARAAASGLAVEVDGASGPGGARWDRQRIEQLLANLLENSLRYTDAPGRVRLSLGSDGPGAALIVVEDSAPGVPASELPRVFDPLYRADPSRSRRSGGSGLGLAICRAIVASHGGRIDARASALGGLAVTVWLPLQPPPGSAA